MQTGCLVAGARAMPFGRTWSLKSEYLRFCVRMFSFGVPHEGRQYPLASHSSKS